jgi:hypothetical protein
MNKKTSLISLPIIILLVITGCMGVSHISTSSGIDTGSLNQIPKGSKVIFAEKKDISINDYYEEVLKILMLRGHRILKEDKQRYYITTEGKDVGQSTLQRMTLFITSENNSCILKINTEWKGGTEAAAMATAMSGIPVHSDWAIASWEINRLGMAFAESLAIAKEINNAEIFFE